MKARHFERIGWVAIAALMATGAMAQQKVDLGKREYDNNCATCHGLDGKGNGPFVELLKRSPPDLTTMARRNGGIFPVAKAYDVVEGAGPGHGGRDMPIWGKDYSVKAAEYYMDVPYDHEAFVRARILSLIEYVNRLQAK
jgi:mono/diheme cytochrome c family protein